MAAPSSGGDLPAISSAKFCAGSLPRPYLYNDVKFTKERIDPPSPIADPFLLWARDAQLTMSSLRFERRRSQGRIDGSIKRLREDVEVEEEEEEEEEERGKQKKRSNKGTIGSEESEEAKDGNDSDEKDEAEEANDSEESKDCDDSEEDDEEEAEDNTDSEESEDSDDSEEEDEANDTTDSEDFKDSEDIDDKKDEKQSIKGKPTVAYRRSKRLRKMVGDSDEE